MCIRDRAEAAREAVENDVHVVGVSSLAAGHKTLGPQIIEELKKMCIRDSGGALQEFFFHAVVHDKGYITLAVAEFGGFERVVSHAVLIFHDRQELETLGKYGQLLGMDADFAHLGTEYESFDTDEVA